MSGTVKFHYTLHQQRKAGRRDGFIIREWSGDKMVKERWTAGNLGDARSEVRYMMADRLGMHVSEVMFLDLDVKQGTEVRL